MDASKAAPKVGDRLLHNGKLHQVVSVMPIWSEGSSGSGRVAEVRVEGYCLGLRRIRWYEAEDDF